MSKLLLSAVLPCYFSILGMMLVIALAQVTSVAQGNIVLFDRLCHCGSHVYRIDKRESK